MRRIFGLVCVKNEADRYLEASLRWNSRFLDSLFIFDDKSDDETVSIAKRFGFVTLRADHEPSFTTHEGQFRQAAWDVFEQTMVPTEEDWVLALDADEFLVSNFDTAECLHTLADQSLDFGYDACQMRIPEVFEVDEYDRPYVRVDGFWRDNWNVRFCRYQRDARFRDAQMACGSTPTYAQESATKTIPLIEILHFGYVTPAERILRHQRYTDHPVGHNPQHVASIITPPELQEWGGQIPEWRSE